MILRALLLLAGPKASGPSLGFILLHRSPALALWLAVLQVGLGTCPCASPHSLRAGPF